MLQQGGFAGPKKATDECHRKRLQRHDERDAVWLIETLACELYSRA